VAQYRVVVPEIGEAIDQGTLLRWLSHLGGQVRVGEPLFEFATDKVDSEIPSPVAGTMVEILVAEGSTIDVGAEVCIIEQALDDGVPSIADPSTTTASRVPPPPEGPVVRSPVRSSGSTGAPLPPLPGETSVRHGAEEGGVIEHFSRIRAATAQVMSTSASTIPHVLSVVEADYSAVASARHRWPTDRRRPTPLAFVTKAVAEALQRYPQLNSSVVPGGLRLHDRIDIAIAVDTPDGLVAPVIRQAESLEVAEIAEAIAELAEIARNGKLTPGHLSGATFTISNNGSAGSVLTTPLITPPQVAVLSVDKVVDRPVVVTVDNAKGVGIKPIGNLSMCWDHRAVDGVRAAAFLVAVAERLEAGWSERA